MSRNFSPLRPIPDFVINIFPEGDRAAAAKWLNDWLKQSIDPSQVKQNQVADLETDLTTVSSSITTVSATSTTHMSDTSAHGVTGDIVGTGDLATEATTGVVKQAAAVTDASSSGVSVDAADAGATYTSAEQTLINELKSDVNTLKDNLNSAITQLNDALAKLRTSGALNS